MKEQNFKFRKTFAKLVEQMTDKQAGEFIKAVSGYVFLGKPMESKDEFLKGVFVYVKSALDAEIRDRENGKLGAKKKTELRIKAERNQSACITRVLVGGDGMEEFLKDIFPSGDDGEGSGGNILAKS